MTTNKKLNLKDIAIHMVARWSQENFFRYMRQDYAFDKMEQHAIEQIDGDLEVVNQEYNRLDYRLKKTRENIAAKEICDILNKQNVIYPDTELRLCYKMAI
ncbi:MAG: hypothetical protein Q8N05_08145 [Bacteroidota bacterium]|nr:hypothetical protein [Bacteroidota bacterium]